MLDERTLRLAADTLLDNSRLVWFTLYVAAVVAGDKYPSIAAAKGLEALRNWRRG